MSCNDLTADHRKIDDFRQISSLTYHLNVYQK
jgi:hypothetical protein